MNVEDWATASGGFVAGALARHYGPQLLALYKRARRVPAEIPSGHSQGSAVLPYGCVPRYDIDRLERYSWSLRRGEQP